MIIVSNLVLTCHLELCGVNVVDIPWRLLHRDGVHFRACGGPGVGSLGDRKLNPSLVTFITNDLTSTFRKL